MRMRGSASGERWLPSFSNIDSSWRLAGMGPCIVGSCASAYCSEEPIRDQGDNAQATVQTACDLHIQPALQAWSLATVHCPPLQVIKDTSLHQLGCLTICTLNEPTTSGCSLTVPSYVPNDLMSGRVKS